jgi:protein-disulfide isomerase
MSRHVLRTLPLLFWLFFASGLSASGQDIKPGASPSWTVGNSNASVSLEVFNDYQCPPCGPLNEELKIIKAKYKDNVQIIFRNYPLTNMHKNALLAARAAEAAGLQGHFIEMIDQLYGNLKYWAKRKNARPLFMSYARKLNLDLVQFARDLDGEVVRERIRLDVERAKSLEVNGTPTILLNGKMLYVTTIDKIAPLIEEALTARTP